MRCLLPGAPACRSTWERTIAGGCVLRIELIPLGQMAPVPRWILEEGVTAGPFAKPVPPQIFAYNTS